MVTLQTPAAFVVNSREAYGRWRAKRESVTQRRAGKSYTDWCKRAIRVLRLAADDFTLAEEARNGRPYHTYWLTERAGQILDRYVEQPRMLGGRAGVRTRLQAEIQRTGVHTCRYCKRALPVSEFKKNMNAGVETVANRCMACHRKETSRNVALRCSTLEGALQWQFKITLQRCQKKGIPFDIDPGFLVDLWHKQGGRCYYSGLRMVYHRRSMGKGPGQYKTPMRVSIDRIDSRGGYTRENIVLCLWVVNRMKADFPLKLFLFLAKHVAATSTKADAG